MKIMSKLLVRLVSLCLSFALLSSITVSAYGDSGNKKIIFGLHIDSDMEETEVGVSVPSKKERLDDCNQKYNDYQEDSKDVNNVGTTMPDGFSLVRTIEGEIRQIQVFSPEYSKAKNPEKSYYSPLEDYSVIYYFEDGLPYFALCYDDNTKPRDQLRFYLSQGEIIHWIDEDGEESDEAPEEFFFLYDHAMSAYSRAMYDSYDKGKYAIQAGSFKDKGQAEACRDSLIQVGQDARVENIDNVYCVLIGNYRDWDKAAEAFEDMELTDECGITYVRLI